MKAERDSVNERIWAYLHGEGGDEERRAFEQELARDDELRSEVERARQLDRALRLAMPALSAETLDEEALAARALADWERQGACDSPTTSPARRWPLQAHPAFRRLAVGLSSVAAAAALVVVVTQQLRPPQQAKWEAPTVVPLAWRGADVGPAGHAVDARAAQRCREALMAAVSRVAAARRAALPPGLIFSLRVQELRNGAFSVSVRARSFAGRGMGEWDGTYSGVAAFLAHAEASAGRIVDEVAAPSGGAQGGRP